MKCDPMDSTCSTQVFLLVLCSFSIYKGCFYGRKEGWKEIPPDLTILGEISSNYLGISKSELHPFREQKKLQAHPPQVFLLHLTPLRDYHHDLLLLYQ